MTLEAILAQNLTTLMAEKPGLDTVEKVAVRAGVGRGTVDRLKKAEVSAKLETVELLAAAFGVPPVQLLTLNNGEGKSFTLPPAPNEKTASHTLQWNSHDESGLLEKYRRLDAKARRTVQQMVDVLLGNSASNAANDM